MNAYYVLSVVGSRLFGLAAAVLLSYILIPHDFGVFTLVSTNALLIHLVYSSWISNSSWKDVSVLAGSERATRISNSLAAAAAWSIFPVTIAIVLLLIDFARFQYIGLMIVLAISILFYDLLLVIKNAQGLARDYSAMSLLRGILTFGFSISLVLCGFGLRGAVGGQVVGIILVIICQRSFWPMWRHIEPRHFSWANMYPQLRFGLISAFALNLYLMGNGLCRDLILFGIGEADAGYFSLAADMFYAPIALFATALSLSSVPELYRSAGDDAAPSRAGDFLTGVVAVAIPYGTAGIFLGSSIVNLLLGSNVSPHISPIAPHSIIHAACFSVLSTQTTIALTQGKLKVAVGLPIATLLLLAIVLLGTSVISGADGLSLLSYARATTFTLLLAVIAVLITSNALIKVSVSWGECLRVFGASATMCVVLAAVARLPLPFGPLPAILMGGTTFVGVAWLLGSRVVRNLVRLSAG